MIEEKASFQVSILNLSNVNNKSTNANTFDTSSRQVIDKLNDNLIILVINYERITSYFHTINSLMTYNWLNL